MPETVQASIPIASIKINGTSNADVERDLEEVVVDTSQNLPSMATIRLHDPNGQWLGKGIFKIATPIEVSLAPSRSMQKIEAAAVFKGEIVSVEPSFSALGTSMLTVRAYDKSHRLHIGTKTRTYQQMTDADIVRKIAGECGLAPGTVVSKVKHEYVLQNNLTDFEFLSVRAKRANCILSVVADKLNFAPPADLKEDGPTFDMGESLREFSVRSSGTQQGKEILVKGWDVATKKEIVGRASTPKEKWTETGLPANGSGAGSAFGNQTLALTTFVPVTQDEATLLAMAALNDQQGRYVEADGICYGHPQMVAGKVVNLTSIGAYSGKYYVTSATHIFNSAGYEIHFTVSGRYPQNFNQLLNPNEGGEREPGSLLSVVVGIVTNRNDPNKLGRVKVKYPWLSDTEESNWARIATPGAGANRGVFWVPEVNDEVLIAFDHGNVNVPYVIGSLWNGKDSPPEAQNLDLRVIKSRSGHIIHLNDKAGAESILIQDKTGKNSILIDSVKNDIAIKADGNLTIDVKGKIMVTAQLDISMESKTGKVDIKGTSGLKIETPATLTMKGSIAQLQASGPVTVKGNPIALN
jgi:phage protein D/phage baseplate assembly protein gpV